MTNNKLPNSFDFTTVWDGTRYHAEREGIDYKITWQPLVFEERSHYYYSAEQVEEYVASDLWKIVEQKEEKLVKKYEHPSGDLLQKLKQFTINTSASVWIHNGEYEVYYNATDNPAKCDSDEELSKLVDAIAVLDKATYGKA